MNVENLNIQIKTFYGLEEILAKEIQKLGGQNIEIKNRAVTCKGDLGFLYKVNYSCRTSLKVLVPILNFIASNEKQFYNKIFSFSWDTIMDLNQSFSIDATIHSETFRHSQFITLKMKDAIVDFFKTKYKKRPNVETKNSDIKLHLHIDKESVCVSLDSSGEPLFKRGYKQETTPAPINEVLAAGMLQLAGWAGKENFLDPMCGSGTLLIEAAMIGLNIPAQIFRKSNFAFQNWKNYNSELFSTIKTSRINKIRPFDNKIIGYDIDKNAINAAISNIKYAQLEDIIHIERKNFFASKKENFPLLMVFNPPYNNRISTENDDFYKKIGDTLKNYYQNTFSWIISSDLEMIKKIGLKPSSKIKLFNGQLECRFLQYETYNGTKKLSKKSIIKN